MGHQEPWGLKTRAVLLREAHSLEEMASADHVLWLLGAGLGRCWDSGCPRALELPPGESLGTCRVCRLALVSPCFQLCLLWGEPSWLEAQG